MSLLKDSLSFPSYPDLNFAYQYTLPTATAAFKRELSDFKVNEVLGFTPTGAGEHIFVQVEKTGLNTAYVAEQFASFTQLPLRNVTYAGRKDKFSTSTQWFGIHCPGKKAFAWDEFTLGGVKILQVTRHDKKLRTGVLKHNQFIIKLREVSDIQAIIDKLAAIEKTGVPNYYGQQRFGEVRFLDEQQQQQTKVGGNLILAEQLFTGGKIKNRNKRSVAISALRSWLFNVCVSQRIQSGTEQTILAGDVVMLTGSNSYFIAQHDELASLQQRFNEHDVDLSAPLWGQGTLAAQDVALALESQLAISYPQICESLALLGLKQERRALHLLPQDITTQIIDDTTLTISFTLPVGCFATSVLRECCITHT
ncbi:MAG: tRNA pseudouridine(13) synthase TruD [Glaciecola sp.]|jgi:tRNA pseudouridine13 synthase|nr:tRNA pseudouridine(13) synthase TruD [Glaciecola sp.]MDG1815345.1 tRNA pseudouridine(13) synthase TruD [Glaciecola sp.]MDG2099956.1 tRNA pseudouridine(13) synthase TruD [Glaciecola sp.]